MRKIAEEKMKTLEQEKQMEEDWVQRKLEPENRCRSERTETIKLQNYMIAPFTGDYKG